MRSVTRVFLDVPEQLLVVTPRRNLNGGEICGTPRTELKLAFKKKVFNYFLLLFFLVMNPKRKGQMGHWEKALFT